jgi:hypothetical protein
VPTIAGDTLEFTPTKFAATAAGMGASDSTIGTLSFTLVALSGSRIATIALSDIGTTEMVGNVPMASVDTATSVSAAGTISIDEIDFGSIVPLLVPFSLTMVPSGGTHQLGWDGSGGPSYSSPFSGSVTLDIAAMLLANAIPFTFGATKVAVNVDNVLHAASQPGTLASIGTHGFTVLTTTIPVRQEVPEPSIVLLVSLGLVCHRIRQRCG